MIEETNYHRNLQMGERILHTKNASTIKRGLLKTKSQTMV